MALPGWICAGRRRGVDPAQADCVIQQGAMDALGSAPGSAGICDAAEVH